ncbi:hypothetical protein FB561_1854 [Kribbella amoyensis]|uniref:Uncharacterized protein n=1 Tax=Kribbella amoyensis TaxID=996641 RepID=A0A561BPG5_9ACTN|nr:hypothetical protein [Kribbella amoyensis]TWD80765.1 hypothetical protein FB561_1854 [Kribbella amoyensis]
MTTTGPRGTEGGVATRHAHDHLLPVLTSRLLTRRRVIDQMLTASATCR